MSDMELFFKRAAALLDRLERFIPEPGRAPAFDSETSSCWRYSAETNRLETVRHPATIHLDDLKCIDRQKDLLVMNTRQFIHGLPANNALLWGPRGTGKSSLIKAILNEYSDQGLKIIEIAGKDLNRLPEICDLLYEKNGRYIIFCDDLSFEADDPSYKAIKVILDGSTSQAPDNVLIYATSNRRHLMPEYMSENLQSGYVDEELHMADSIEEKLALSERFGLWIAFHPLKQDDYLEIVNHWLSSLSGQDKHDWEEVRTAALQWALLHGSRSGRSALLFSRDWAGKSGLKKL
ncbi:MAG: ATP-binding protein [Gammaproteobacteria bacterium]